MVLCCSPTKSTKVKPTLTKYHSWEHSHSHNLLVWWNDCCPPLFFSGFLSMKCVILLSGPPTPSSVNVSLVMSNNTGGLSVSWECNQEVFSPTEYYVSSDQGITCNSTSSSCTLSPVGCGKVHTIQVTAFNKAGPSYTSSPVVFITCE